MTDGYMVALLVQGSWLELESVSLVIEGSKVIWKSWTQNERTD